MTLSSPKGPSPLLIIILAKLPKQGFTMQDDNESA